jgi:hypothetical protein
MEIPPAIAAIAPDGQLTPAQRRRFVIDFCLRRIKPGTGSAPEFLQRRTAMNPWPDLQPILHGIPWVVIVGSHADHHPLSLDPPSSSTRQLERVWIKMVSFSLLRKPPGGKSSRKLGQRSTMPKMSPRSAPMPVSQPSQAFGKMARPKSETPPLGAFFL